MKILWIPVLALLLAGCGSDEPQSKNRVPTVQAQLDQAQQAAQNAKASADRAAQTQKDIQAAVDRLDNAGRRSDGSVKIGHPEMSGVGTVTDVGMGYITIDQSTTGVLWFTFAQRDGFVKKFESVCPDQVIPVSKAVVLNFHFREYQNASHPGCFVIDSYTVVQ